MKTTNTTSTFSQMNEEKNAHENYAATNLK